MRAWKLLEKREVSGVLMVVRPQHVRCLGGFRDRGDSSEMSRTSESAEEESGDRDNDGALGRKDRDGERPRRDSNIR